jgi:hypothetical protein
MHDSNSRAGLQRRRALGVFVGAAVLVTPFVAAPAASAANRNPLGGTDLLLQGVIQGLPNTISHPVGDGAGDGGCQGIDGIGTLATCLVDPLGPNRASKTKVKASMTSKIRSVRWVMR